MKSAGFWLGFYNAVLVGFAPLLLLKKAIKFGRRGHRHEWDFGRWTAPKSVGDSDAMSAKTASKRVVVVALSWGEIGILAQITARLESELPHLHILWSIRDRAAQEMARRQFPNREIVPMPFDFCIPVQNWLGAVRPDALILVEKFWWPNLIWGAKMRGAQVILVNGRSRGREKLRYKLGGSFQKWVLSGFDALLFESEAQIERVRAVLPRGARIAATGNVKFAFAAPKTAPDAADLESWLAGAQKPIFIAGSTSPIDEKWALDAFEIVKKAGPCSLLLAPRRVERAGEVAREIEARGLSLGRRSAPTHGENAGAEVFLLDTLGELFAAYRYGAAAYVGGSVEGRGHNIIEPLAHGIAVGYGPNRGDFEAAQRAAEEFEVGFRLHSARELAQFWQRGRDADFRREIAARAALLLENQRGSLDATVAILRDLLR